MYADKRYNERSKYHQPILEISLVRCREWNESSQNLANFIALFGDLLAVSQVSNPIELRPLGVPMMWIGFSVHRRPMITLGGTFRLEGVK